MEWQRRAAIGGTQQAVDDLQRALPAITAVATLGQRTAASLHVARRDVVEHQGAVLEVAPGQCGLDRGLALQQPVERGIKFGITDRAEAKRFAEAGGRRGGRQRPGRGELGDGIEDAADQHSQNEIAAAVAVGAEDALEANFTCRTQRSGDMAVRQAAGDGEGVVLGGDDGATLEHAAQALDMGGRPAGEVAQRAFTHLAARAVALAQQDGGRGVPVRDGFDIHRCMGIDPAARYK
ncbi:hypothetical protein CCS01_12485 [Rhodopila globiformis]|uniref:Uncharacterized protein n=1 Tax=Rhodopila globiformis TaxID=1071 RepID=A0A2S6NHK5_RHOGL|nr:hypothetical protein CCS01_12485 [Rhodopila globiformis]